MMARKTRITDDESAEDFVTLVSRIPVDTFLRMVRAAGADLPPKDARALCNAFREFKG